MKQEVMELAKARGAEIAEDAVKEAAHLALDIVKLLVEKSENKIDDAVMLALEGQVRDMVDKIDF